MSLLCATRGSKLIPPRPSPRPVHVLPLPLAVHAGCPRRAAAPVACTSAGAERPAGAERQAGVERPWRERRGLRGAVCVRVRAWAGQAGV